MKQTAPTLPGNIGRTWPASLVLGFEHRQDRTVLGDMHFHGPLRVQRPFYPEGPVCHCYLLHPPGGLVSGDRLHVDVSVQAGAHALLTTPSAGKIYGADSCGVQQGQQVRLSVQNGVIEWLPMETIVFNAANAVMSIELDLDATASAIGWEILCLGRPEGNALFCSGQAGTRLSIHRDGKPLLLERLDVSGGSALQHGAFGLGGHTVCGTMFAASPDPALPELVPRLREVLIPAKGTIGVTCRRGVLQVRYLGDRAEEARRLFEQAWQIIRLNLLGIQACAPRIWAT